MATRETSGTNIDPGFVARVVTGVKYALTGVGPTNFFGPGQPLAPAAQDRAEGRMFDFPTGANYQIRPRANENISFEQLRGLADAYDLMRLVIETRKDQIEAFEWEIVPYDETQSAEQFKDDIKRATDFLLMPDKEHDWPQWLRMLLEELLVIDAMCVYPRLNRGNTLYGLELVDGSTIKRVLDETGRTPLPPEVAYQQILKGIPAADYSRDDLVYVMRNPRTSRVYGYSPVEQVITTVNIALRRQMSQLDFYTAGNVPEALVQVDANWTPKQIKDYQADWDALMEGNTAARRKMRFIPPAKQIDFPRKEILKDDFDEWLARIVCFAFSISPSALIKQVNRASGQQMADTAKEEGLMPTMRFLGSFMTMLVRKHMGLENLRFRWKVVNTIDPLQQAQINGIYIDKEVITPDEVREEIGKDAMTAAQREEAFPTPIPPGMNPDGTPILPKGAPGAGAPGGDGAGAAGGAAPPAVDGKPKAAETAAEKMLAEALRMLDPATLAKVIADAARSQAPRVVEIRPEVSVDVGDTVVHVPVGRQDGGLAKRSDAVAASIDGLAAAIKERPASVVTVNEAAITVNTPDQTINVAAPEVHPTINVAAPTVNVAPAEVNVTNTVPPAAVEVHQEVAGSTVDTIERNDRGDVVRVTHKPLK